MTEAEVADALREVIDPEVGINVVDLGLVYRVAIEGRHIRLIMTMTSPACPLGDYLTEMVRIAIKGREPDAAVDVELVWSPKWDPTMMSDAAKRQLGWRDS